MPYFIDRHEPCATLTPEFAARRNLEDLKIQKKFNCRKICYWYDENQGTAFCLFEAPDKACLEALHNYAHTAIPNQIIEIDKEVVHSFIRQIQKLPTIDKLEITGTLPTFLACDLRVNPMNSKNSEYKSVYSNYISAVNSATDSQGGNIISQIGTFVLISFQSGPTAIRCALKIRKKFYSGSGPNTPGQQLKIGICGGILGETGHENIKASVRLAKRLCYMAHEKILVTLEVRNMFQRENVKVIIKGDRIKSVSPDDISFISSLLDYMENNWRNPELHASDFETHLGCSKSQIYRKLVALVNQSPNVFIKEYRLNRAIEMLRQRKGNISEVAFDAGFGSPSYFTKCFQKEYHIKPSEYLSELG